MASTSGGEIQPPTVVEADGWELTSASIDQPTPEEATARITDDSAPESGVTTTPEVGDDADAPGPAVEASEPSPSEAPPQDGRPKKKQSSAERIAEVRQRVSEETRAYHDARRAREWELSEIDRLKRERQQLEQQPPPQAAAAPDDKPTWTKFEEEGKSYDDFLDKRDEWNRRQVAQEIATMRQRDQQQLQQQQREQQTWELNRQYQTRLQAAMKAHPDYLTVVNQNLSDVPDNPFINELVRSHEKGPEVLYHLANNPDEAKVVSTLQPARWVRDAIRYSDIPTELVSYLAQHPGECDELSRMKPASALVALGVITAQLKGANHGSPFAETVSRAKPPIRPVGGSQPSASTDLSDAPFSPEWVAAENKREHEARRARSRRF